MQYLSYMILAVSDVSEYCKYCNFKTQRRGTTLRTYYAAWSNTQSAAIGELTGICSTCSAMGTAKAPREDEE
jgi:hypothetical protein